MIDCKCYQYLELACNDHCIKIQITWRKCKTIIVQATVIQIVLLNYFLFLKNLDISVYIVA